MSLITRCPACETLFKVVPDQLRISQGWVRCGQCSEVFDASLHMLPETVHAGSADEPVQSPEAASLASTPQASTPVDINLDDAPPGDPVAQLTVQSFAEIVADDALVASPVQAVAPESPPDIVLVIPAPAPFAIPISVHQHPSDEADVDDLSFLRTRSAKSVGQKPFARIALAFFSIVLLLGLAAQIVFHDRDRLVAQEPQIGPQFQTVCEWLKCTIAPLKRIDLVAIESSTFVNIRVDVYRLNFTLTNKSQIALAAPAVEVTLTNSLDQPVLRRVFYPAQWGASSPELAANVELSSSMVLAAKTEVSGDRVAGYRLLAFYP